MKATLSLALIIISFLSLSQQNANELIPFKKGQKWGYSDINGKLKINADYDKVEFFYYDKLALVYQGDSCGFINREGRIIVPIAFSSCERLIKTYFRVQKNGKIGVMDTSKNYVVSLSYELIKPLDNTFILVKNHGKYGIVNISSGKGQMIVKTEYDTIIYHSNKKRFICDKSGIHYINNLEGGLIEQRKIIKGKQISEFDEQDMVGNMVNSRDHDGVSEFFTYPRYQTIYKDNRKGLIVKTMDGFTHEVQVDTIKPLYDSINPKHWFSNCFVVKKDGKWGAVNSDGKIIIDIKYDEIDIASMNFQAHKPYLQVFVVKLGDKWGAIGNNNDFGQSYYPNEIIVPFEYDEVSSKWVWTCLVLKSNNTYGLMLKSPNRKDMIGPTPMKYSSINSVRSSDDLSLVLVTDNEGNTYYVGQNGVEFFEK